MKASVFFRKFHYWASICILAPVLVVIVTGLLLQVKKQWPWVQPVEQKGSGKVPTLSFDDILAACQSEAASEAGVKAWGDVARIDVRPNKGLIKVTAKSGYEIQVDGTGKVLQVAYRRSDVIEAIHDGSWFHESAKLWLFLPSGVVLFCLALTGAYLFVLPLWVKWRRKSSRASRTEPAA